MACGSSPDAVVRASLVASPWVADVPLSDRDGKVLPEFISAALDCPGAFAAREDMVPMLLGEFTAHIDRRVHVDEPCVVIGWKIQVQGRKYEVGTALFDEDGELCARAQACGSSLRAACRGPEAARHNVDNRLAQPQRSYILRRRRSHAAIAREPAAPPRHTHAA